MVPGSEHSLPPFWGGCKIVLVSFLFPPPQVLSHGPSLNSLHTQSAEMGELKILLTCNYTSVNFTNAFHVEVFPCLCPTLPDIGIPIAPLISLLMRAGVLTWYINHSDWLPPENSMSFFTQKIMECKEVHLPMFFQLHNPVVRWVK